MNIKHIFFDLDRTLWDFEKNSKTTLLKLIEDFDLINHGINDSLDFIKRYKLHNSRLWDLYRDNVITKEELRDRRFLLTLKEYNINDSLLAESIGIEYVKKSPLQTALFPFTLDTLIYLSEKYQLHIITNGFKEVQHIKLKNSGLDRFFNIVVTSEQVGVKKPHQKIFKYALNEANALAKESIMIGDDLEADILGAQNVGIKGIYFNPEGDKSHKDVFMQISTLDKLKEIL